MNPHEMMPNWRKATYSGNNTACVEVGGAGDYAGIRDTKQEGMAEDDRPALVVSRNAFAAFVGKIKDGSL